MDFILLPVLSSDAHHPFFVPPSFAGAGCAPPFSFFRDITAMQCTAKMRGLFPCARRGNEKWVLNSRLPVFAN
jgi:hypothetical protein